MTTPAGFGGLESVVEMLARGTSDRGHDVCVVAIVESSVESHPFVKRLADRSIEFVQVRVPARGYVTERRSVRAELVRCGAQVMHCHGYRVDVADSGVGRSLGLAVVSTVHGFTGGGLRNPIYEWLQIRSYRKFDGVVAVSQPIVDRLVAAGVPKAIVRLVRNSYRARTDLLSRSEARELLGLDSQYFHVGWVGRLSAEKGPDVMLEATRALSDRGVLVSFIGDGPMLEGLKSQATEAGSGPTLRFHGVVPDSARLMKAFDAVAISSRTEGTPIVLLESIAAGVPVVATRVGGIPDVVSSEEAILITSENARELSDGIVRLKHDPALAARLATAASARVSRELNYEHWLDSYEDVYEAAIRLRRSKP